MILIYLTIFVLLLFVLSLVIGFIRGPKKKQPTISDNDGKIDKKFYTVDETFPDLNKIYRVIDEVKIEYQQNKKNPDMNKWTDWPEKELYDANSDWKIIPFKAFDVTVEENCKAYPYLWQFINSVPNVKVAILSKLGPGMKLTPHRGWGNHSNNVLRCHFGLEIPIENKCYISVADQTEKDGKVEVGPEEIQYHSQDRWMVFDDSKRHYAENPADKNRVVLIMDIDRPNHIAKGVSTEEDTPELLEIVNRFRTK